MKNKATKQELENSLNEMREIVDNPDVPEEYKVDIRKSIKEAEKLVEKIEAHEKSASEKEGHAKVAHHEKRSKMAEEAHEMVASLSEKIKEFNKNRSKSEIDNDSRRHAKPPGKRVSDTGHIYYEYRPNRSDINQHGKPYLKEGGMIDKEAFKNDTISSGVRIAVIANEHDIKASDMTFKEFADKVFEVTHTAYPVYKLRFAWEVLKKNHLCCGGNLEMAAHKEYERGGVMIETKDHYHYRLGGKLPDYWGKGHNIIVFGYQTLDFDNSSIAAAEFEHAIATIVKEEDGQDRDEYTKKCMENLRLLAEQVDNLLALEKLYYVKEGPDEKSFEVVAIILTNIGRYDYKSGGHVHLAFLGEHLYHIALANGPATMADGGEIAELPQTAFEEKAKFSVDDVVILVGKKHKIVSEPVPAWPGEYRYDVEPVEEKTEPVEGAAPVETPEEEFDYPVREELMEAAPAEVVEPLVETPAPAEEPTPEELETMKRGGEINKRVVKFSDKVKAIEDRLKGTKVPSKYKNEYGTTYTTKTAKEAATKIAGKIVADEHKHMEDGGTTGFEVIGHTKAGLDVYHPHPKIYPHHLVKNAHKKMIRALPNYTKADHLEAARIHDEEAKKLNDTWHDEVKHAHMETFHEPWTAFDYRVSGIGSDQYSEVRKHNLRLLTRQETAHKDAAELHRDAAKVINRMKYR